MANRRSFTLNRRHLLAAAAAPLWLSTTARAVSAPAALNITALTAAFYAARGGRPAWAGPARRQAMDALALADRHGLSAPDGLALSEAELTQAVLTLAEALAHGRVDPASVETLWEMGRNQVATPPLLATAVDDGTLAETMAGLAPQDRGYQGL